LPDFTCASMWGFAFKCPGVYHNSHAVHDGWVYVSRNAHIATIVATMRDEYRARYRLQLAILGGKKPDQPPYHNVVLSRTQCHIWCFIHGTRLINRAVPEAIACSNISAPPNCSFLLLKPVGLCQERTWCRHHVRCSVHVFRYRKVNITLVSLSFPCDLGLQRCRITTVLRTCDPHAKKQCTRCQGLVCIHSRLKGDVYMLSRLPST